MSFPFSLAQAYVGRGVGLTLLSLHLLPGFCNLGDGQGAQQCLRLRFQLVAAGGEDAARS